MSLFAKKQEWDPKANAEAGGASAASLVWLKPAYGIAEAIQLMRSLPVDQHPIWSCAGRATLGSLNAHLPDIIEDFSPNRNSRGAHRCRTRAGGGSRKTARGAPQRDRGARG